MAERRTVRDGDGQVVVELDAALEAGPKTIHRVFYAGGPHMDLSRENLTRVLEDPDVDGYVLVGVVPCLNHLWTACFVDAAAFLGGAEVGP